MRDYSRPSSAVQPSTPGLTRTVASQRPFNLALTLRPLRRGPGDPTYRVTEDQAHWRAARMPTGPVTYRITQQGTDGATARAWGPGAQEFIDKLDQILCIDENIDDFTPDHPKIVEAHRVTPGLRMLKTGLVFEGLVPVILEQKVHTVAAHASWRQLVRKFGERPPGPAPADLVLPPDAEGWRHIPSWWFHKANVGPERSQTIVRAARVADAIDRTAELPSAEARERLQTIVGVGQWTTAELAQRVFGDADALSVGDYHIAALVGWTLLDRPIDDDEMVELLEPLRPHRHRAVRLLIASGIGRKPKFGPRTEITDHRMR
ncbi:DNA-3-methyladenine glycosylase family protein [Nocardia camponoti]|uniref:DNA-3-methyladenine glycosylase II n=1 Tax=Nocardia camponoti TaxID=1616106 RepID=A0A917V9I0_9NOCA|nr:DNA-3-methyladenine glycosylase 2 family protein [Nocardia camponoti]GGK54099.1 hypothetical protein GCM10011591_27380 [Nocardia camponoti]